MSTTSLVLSQDGLGRVRTPGYGERTACGVRSKLSRGAIVSSLKCSVQHLSDPSKPTE